MPRTRLATLMAALVLALPAHAGAQVADADRAGEPPATSPSPARPDPGEVLAQVGDGQDGGGLSDLPRVPGAGADDGDGAGGGDGGDGAARPGRTTTEPSSPGAGGEGARLPRTGADPRLLLLTGLALVLAGIGLRLRTLDPDAF